MFGNCPSRQSITIPGFLTPPCCLPVSNNVMSFSYLRTIRFRDTDAAGVVYFAQGLVICHEAYEQSLAEAGIHPHLFFRAGDYIVPIIHAEIDFFRPMVCGDRVIVTLQVERKNESSFCVIYQISARDRPEIQLAKAITRHVCLQTDP
jgi:1,4-dihydroxy-2-naphthoyl-CoA hydrolase